MDGARLLSIVGFIRGVSFVIGCIISAGGMRGQGILSSRLGIVQYLVIRG